MNRRVRREGRSVLMVLKGRETKGENNQSSSEEEQSELTGWIVDDGTTGIELLQPVPIIHLKLRREQKG
jgi:hypothetical protein